jgi:hemerythrin-like domain-containing protein
METNGIVIICTLLLATLLAFGMKTIDEYLELFIKLLKVWIDKENEVLKLMQKEIDEEKANQGKKEDNNQELRMKDEYQLP